jgi:hypothetical protein
MKNISTDILKGINRKLTESEVVDGSEIFDVVDEDWGENYSQDLIPAEYIARVVAQTVQDEDKVDIDVFNNLVEEVYNFAQSKEAEIEALISKKLKETNNCRPGGKGTKEVKKIKEAAGTKREFEVYIEEVVNEEFTVEAASMEEAEEQMIEKYNKGEIVLEPGNLSSKSIMVRDPETDEETSWNEF